MEGAASESAAAPVSHNAADPVELNDLCRTKLKLPYQTDLDAALLPDVIHQLGSAHEWRGVWISHRFTLQNVNNRKPFIGLLLKNKQKAEHVTYR